MSFHKIISEESNFTESPQAHNSNYQQDSKNDDHGDNSWQDDASHFYGEIKVLIMKQ